MSVDPATATEKAEYAGVTYHFCSAGCRPTFEKDPTRYTAQLVHVGQTHTKPAITGGEMERRQSAIDPVCGMSVDTAHAEYRSFQDGRTYYFCSAGCKATFDKDPGKYAGPPKTGSGG